MSASSSRDRKAASLSDIPNFRQQGTRLGNWLTREHAKELLAEAERSAPKGNEDYMDLAPLGRVLCARRELASLEIETIQPR